MNIQILDSWLKEYLKTDAKVSQIGEKLSLTSVGVEKIIPSGSDHIYDIEITTNRPDLMSVVGLARDAGAILPQFDIKAKFEEIKVSKPTTSGPLGIEITNDPKLVNRICAVALEVTLKDSPTEIRERLIAAGINPHNNLIDVTNYVMREVGHPMHAFDYDKLAKTGKFIVREAKKGEKIIDLHGDEHTLIGGDIVADDGTGKIIDLLGIMGTENSAVDSSTKKVLLFVDNNNPHKIRKTSMSLGLRSDAAVLNEKRVDPELAMTALLRGVELLKEIADGKVVSEIVDIYPNKFKAKSVSVSFQKIDDVIGVPIDHETSVKILNDLGFEAEEKGEQIEAIVPSWRAADVKIPEDLIEEIARIYGYFKLPSVLPQSTEEQPYRQSQDIFYWERKARESMKYWGFTEVYTYPMVSENLLEVAPDEAVTIKNPLTEDHIYMRTTLVPSLLEAARENKNSTLSIFEIANVYHKRKGDLPQEKLMFAALHKKPKASFFETKGIIEEVFADFGIKDYEFKESSTGEFGADVYIGKTKVGDIEQLEDNIVDFELDFDILFKNSTSAKIYKPASKYPESIEDFRFEIDPTIPYRKIVSKIMEQSELIKRVELLDVYENKKTFRIVYQSFDRNITNENLSQVREKIISSLKKTFKATIA